jgi:hypothetical protein
MNNGYFEIMVGNEDRILNTIFTTNLSSMNITLICPQANIM